VLIDAGYPEAHDLTGVSPGIGHREDMWEDDLIAGPGKHLLKWLVVGMELASGGESEPILEAPDEERRGPTPPDVGVLLLEQAQALRNGLNRRIQVSSGRKVFAQGEDLWHSGVEVVEADGHALDRPDVVLPKLRNLRLDIQDHYVCAIGYPGLDEGCVWQVATPDALGQVSTLRRPQTIDINRVTWSGDVRGRHQRRAPAPARGAATDVTATDAATARFRMVAFRWSIVMTNGSGAETFGCSIVTTNVPPCGLSR
jgi:hypothetical protein